MLATTPTPVAPPVRTVVLPSAFTATVEPYGESSVPLSWRALMVVSPGPFDTPFAAFPAAFAVTGLTTRAWSTCCRSCSS